MHREMAALETCHKREVLSLERTGLLDPFPNPPSMPNSTAEPNSVDAGFHM